MFCCSWHTYTAPSSPPRNYVGVALSSRSILLTWDAPPVEGQNGIIIGYTLNITELETGETSAMFTESNNFTLYSLQPFTTYGCLVSAQTIAGRGPTTHLLSVTTEEEGLSINTDTTKLPRLFSLHLRHLAVVYCTSSVCVTNTFGDLHAIFSFLCSSHWGTN